MPARLSGGRPGAKGKAGPGKLGGGKMRRAEGRMGGRGGATRTVAELGHDVDTGDVVEGHTTAVPPSVPDKPLREAAIGSAGPGKSGPKAGTPKAGAKLGGARAKPGNSAED